MDNINQIKSKAINDFSNKILAVLNKQQTLDTTDFLKTYISYQNKLGVKVTSDDSGDDSTDTSTNTINNGFKQLLKVSQAFYQNGDIGKFETKIFELLTGKPFTVNNAREVLKDWAEVALDYHYNQDDRAGDAKIRFSKTLELLPYKSLPRVANLLRTEILANLQLNHGDLSVKWLTDGQILNQEGQKCR